MTKEASSRFLLSSLYAVGLFLGGHTKMCQPADAQVPDSNFDPVKELICEPWQAHFSQTANRSIEYSDLTPTITTNTLVQTSLLLRFRSASPLVVGVPRFGNAARKSDADKLAREHGVLPAKRYDPRLKIVLDALEDDTGRSLIDKFTRLHWTSASAHRRPQRTNFPRLPTQERQQTHSDMLGYVQILHMRPPSPAAKYIRTLRGSIVLPLSSSQKSYRTPPLSNSRGQTFTLRPGVTATLDGHSALSVILRRQQGVLFDLNSISFSAFSESGKQLKGSYESRLLNPDKRRILIRLRGVQELPDTTYGVLTWPGDTRYVTKAFSFANIRIR